jgi:hypothetical protein
MKGDERRKNASLPAPIGAAGKRIRPRRKDGERE